MALNDLIRNITVVAAMAIPAYACEGDSTTNVYEGNGGSGGEGGSSCSAYCDRFLECDPDFFYGKNDDMNECISDECSGAISSKCGSLFEGVIDCITSGDCSRWTENMDEHKHPTPGNPCYSNYYEFSSCMGFD